MYHDLRDDTGDRLHANLTQKAIKDAVSAVATCRSNWERGDRISKPSFAPRDDASYTMTYDERAATYNRYEATFATVNGPVTCRYVLPRDLADTPYATYVLDRRWSFSTSKLVFSAWT